MSLHKKTAKKKPLTRSEIMGRVKSKNTKIEILLRKALWEKGYRYRVNYKKLAGTPDIVFVKAKLAIFCDSEFWHGKYLMEGKSIPKTNTGFWLDKIRRNIERDKEIDQKLQADGWRILHFWGEDIKKDTLKCVEQIENILQIQIIEKKAQEIVNRVIQTSALENQSPSDEAKRKMLTQAKKMISKMPKSQI